MTLRRVIPAIAASALLAITSLAQANAEPFTGSTGSTGWFGSAGPAAGCPESIDPASFATADDLRELNAKIAGFGLRSTASAEHESMIDWVEDSMRALPGVEIASDEYQIKRWQPSPLATDGPGRDLVAAGKLAVLQPDAAPEVLRTAGAVPYSLPTGDEGRAAPLVYLPPGTPITPENAKGRIVIRDVQSPAVPYATFAAFSHYMTPDFPLAGNYERPFTAALENDPLAAGLAGATGLILAWNVPAEQIQGYFDPHTGTHFTVPAVWAGVDEAVRLKQLAESGTQAKISVLADVDTAPTRNLIATLPGQSPEKIVINTHTDGATWVQENGSAAVLALAQYLSRLPLECRPRTYEFVFASAHLHMSQEGTDRYATELDKEYDSGSAGLRQAATGASAHVLQLRRPRHKLPQATDSNHRRNLRTVVPVGSVVRRRRDRLRTDAPTDTGHGRHPARARQHSPRGTRRRLSGGESSARDRCTDMPPPTASRRRTHLVTTLVEGHRIRTVKRM